MHMPFIIEQVGRNKKTFDIPTKLFEKNIVTLFDEINDDVAGCVITQLLYLDTLDDKEDINLYVNSPGGSVTAGLAIIDTIDLMTRKVNTVGVGSCASMGAMILMSATGIRKSLKSTRIMLHSVGGGFGGNYHDQKVQFHETEVLQKKLMQMIADKSKMSLKDVEIDNSRDNYMSAETAIELGIIDAIVVK